MSAAHNLLDVSRGEQLPFSPFKAAVKDVLTRERPSEEPVAQAFVRLLSLMNSDVIALLEECADTRLVLTDAPDVDARGSKTPYFDELIAILDGNTASLPYAMLFEDNPVSALLKFFHTESSPSTLRVRDSGAFGKGLLLLATNVLLNNDKIERLEYSGGKLDEEALALLAVGLTRSKSLKQLVLNHNLLLGDNLHVLTAALQKNRAITHLSLDGNFIGDDGARHLADFLDQKDAPALSEVSVRANEIGDAGATALSRALAGHVGVLSLDLNNNFIGNDGARALAQAVAVQETKLQALSLAHNLLEEDGALHFAEALKTNEHLQELSLAGHGLTLDALRDFVDALPAHPSLALLDLGVKHKAARRLINPSALVKARRDLFLKRNAARLSKTTFRIEFVELPEERHFVEYVSSYSSYSSHSTPNRTYASVVSGGNSMMMGGYGYGSGLDALYLSALANMSLVPYGMESDEMYVDAM